MGRHGPQGHPGLLLAALGLTAVAPPPGAGALSDETARPNIPAAKEQARERIETAWGRLEAQLADGRAHLVGSGLTAAGFLPTMLMLWSRGTPTPALRFPHIAGYLRRMRALPSLRLAHEREGLAWDWLDAAAPAGASGSTAGA